MERERHRAEPDDFELGVCTACYVTQQRLNAPYVMYCPHRSRLVRVTGRGKLETWPLTADEMLELVTSRRRGTDAVSRETQALGAGRSERGGES